MQSAFSFNMSTPKGDKQAGAVHVDLAQILNESMEFL